ncbi:nitrous oxide reductase accessory protein NosL [Acidovorax sp. Q11]
MRLLHRTASTTSSTCPPPNRRAALTALLVLGTGAAAGAAWRWRRGNGTASSAALPGPGDDVCIVAPPTPYDPTSGLPLAAAREVPTDARCPVCGMYPARARAWAAQVIFAQGDAYFFDSPLSLMLYLGNVAHYTRGRTPDAIVARYVSDAGTGAWVDAHQAVYVAGSSALGPMRAGNLPAFAGAAEARRFAQVQGGAVLTFSAIDAALLRGLAPHLRADHRLHAQADQALAIK